MSTSEEERTGGIRLGERQSIEELSGGLIKKTPRTPRRLKAIAAERGDEADREDVEAWREGYRPGMGASAAREAGIDERTFVSQEIEHHMEDLGMPQDQAVAAALDEARRGGFDVPREREEPEKR